MNHVLMSASQILADGDGNGDHMMWDSGGGWMWLWGTLMMLLFVAVVAVAVVWIVRSTQQHTPPQAGVSGAEQILAERYARGEISSEEYRERLDGLR